MNKQEKHVTLKSQMDDLNALENLQKLAERLEAYRRQDVLRPNRYEVYCSVGRVQAKIETLLTALDVLIERSEFWENYT